MSKNLAVAISSIFGIEIYWFINSFSTLTPETIAFFIEFLILGLIIAFITWYFQHKKEIVTNYAEKSKGLATVMMLFLIVSWVVIFFDFNLSLIYQMFSLPPLIVLAFEVDSEIEETGKQWKDKFLENAGLLSTPLGIINIFSFNLDFFIGLIGSIIYVSIAFGIWILRKKMK